jgi:hypothetical protein
MSEQELFEARLRTALRRYAADATSDLDPVAFAHLVATRAPRGGRAWPSLRSSSPVLGYALWLLLLAALLAIAVGVVGALNQPHPLGLGRPGVIAFDTGGHVVLADANGASRHDLSSAAGGDYLPSWSPDGTKVAFWRANGATFSIVLADPDGRTIAVLPTQQPTGDPAAAGYAGGAGGPLAWSPDGSRLACWMLTGTGDQAIPLIFIVPVDGSPPTQVGDPSIPAADPAWSPDGGQIAFAGVGGFFPYPNVAADSNGVFVMRADGSGTHRVSHESITKLLPDTQSYREPQWQPGGDRIAYTASPDGSRFHVFTVLPDGTGTRDMTVETGAAASDEDSFPRWSPDGRQLAITRWMSTVGGYHPVIVTADGGRANPFPEVAIDFFWLTWSPDARSILGYVSRPTTGSSKLVVGIDLATRSVREIPIDFEQPARWQWLPP